MDTQITKVQRDLERAQDDYCEADDPSEHRNRMERYRLELADHKDRRADYATLQADAHAKAERC
ncbi:hypothetical protein RCH16_000993 [Cryobacterium sp. MP_M5]|uniref:hypothetical protein n=1 Tax=unclassified Cryobacterium TaxID=2649013 RepID=UPI0018CBB18B|nr:MULTISPECIES: hypothetical protein [unclassified Cryobacterium]MBG6057795.1 hypothetical protein [Cryobacterium sp. MP_M3]MEC5175994.1 hypothetical protein [Cryobacterium sp. MP_M5]